MSRSRFPFALSLCLIAWLFTSGTAVAEMDVNATFIPPGPTISGQSYDPTPATDAPAGTFSFTATFCNSNGPEMPDHLESRTVNLTNGNVLLNRNTTTSTGDGVGSRLHFPATGDYSDLDLPVGECVAVEYRIGLQTSARFQFHVDVWLDRPVILSVSAPSPVLEGDLVHLHAGMGPLDSGETPIFAWLQDSGPTVTLTDADTNNPGFTAPKLQKPVRPMTLVFEVTATLNGETLMLLVDVVVNGAVLVNAGQDKSATVGHRVTLHATSVPNSGAKWKWSQTQGDKVVLTDDDTANPSFTAPATSQTLEFEAVATVRGDAGADRVLVTIVRQTALSVQAGGDLIVVSGDTAPLNCTLKGGVPTTQGWVQFSGAPDVILSGADTLTATFTAPDVTTDTTLVFKCSASGPDGSPEDLLTVTVTPAPPPGTPLSVNAGQDQEVLEGDAVYLHGAGSGGTPPLSYAWTTTAAGITITGADTQNPSFVAPLVSADTAVTLEVTVTDSSSPTPVTKSDSVTYTVKDRTVFVTTGLVPHATSGDSVHLSAQGVGGVPPYTYSWSQSAGSTVTLNNELTENPDFTAPSVTADETLTFDVLVTGALGNTGTGHVGVQVSAPAAPLTVDVTAPTHASKDAKVSLHSTVAGGTKPHRYGYAWSSSPAVAFSPNANVPNPTYSQPDSDVTLTLTVTNPGDASVDSAPVTVTTDKPAGRPPMEIYVCNGPPIICGDRVKIKTCSEPAPYAINYVNNLAGGKRLVERHCGTKDQCQNDWWVTTSDDDKCVDDWNPDAYPNYPFECTWCCTKPLCNRPLKPAESTLYIGQ